MISKTSEKLAVALEDFLKKIDEHCCTLSRMQQPFGICILHPKSPCIPLPTKEMRENLENLARKHFKEKQVGGIVLRYFFPPLMPESEEKKSSKSISVDDYHLTFE